MADLSELTGIELVPKLLQIENGIIKDADGTDATGYLISSNSNSDGFYIKFADGTLICWDKVNFSLSANSADYTWNFPFTFASTYKISPTIQLPAGSSDYDDASDRRIISLAGVVSITNINCLFRILTSVGANFSGTFVNNVYLKAIGKWK